MANKDKLIENAQKFLEKGQLPKAIGEYRKIVEAFPKDFRNRQKLAELLGREKHYEEAQSHYEVVAKNFTDTGFYLKAIAIYKQMQKLDPARVDMYLRLAELNEKQGLIGNSLNEYRSLVALYEKNHKLHDALGILRKMLALEPDNYTVRDKLIETLVAVDEQEEALEQLCALDRVLEERGDTAAIARLHAKFAKLCSQLPENRPSSAPTTGAALDQTVPAPDSGGTTDDRTMPVDVAECPELGCELNVLPPPSPPAATAAGTLPMEIELEIDLDMPSAPEQSAEPLPAPGDAASAQPSAASPSLDALELPDFSDFDLDLASSAESVAGEVDSASSAVEYFPSGDDATVVGQEPTGGASAGQLTPDGMEAGSEVGLTGGSQPADLCEDIEELEEIEEFEDVEVGLPGAGFASLDDDGLDAGVFLGKDGDPGDSAAAKEESREAAEDAQSHFDLGIAYREMGLFKEAIAEFSKAAHEPSRRLDCLTLQAQCRHALGEYKAAEAAFKEALGSGGLTDEVRVALRYELGLLYEETGRTLEALESFQFVADRDLFFRDIVAKLKTLRSSLGLDDQPDDAKGSRTSSDRISYV